MQPSIDVLSLTDQSVRCGRAPAGLSRWFSTSILLLMGLVAAVLLWRRLAGALEQPLPTETLTILGISLAGLVMVVRWSWRREKGHVATGRAGRLMAWCPTALLLLIAAAVLPGSSTSGLVFFWVALVLEEAVMGPWRGRRGKVSPQRVMLGNKKNGPVEPIESCAVDSAWQPRPAIETSTEDLGTTIGPHEKPFLVQDVPEAHVTQQFVRSHTAEGEDVFSGWLRVELPPGTRTTNVHVAFCPPFAHAPAIEVHQVDGPAGRIKTAQALPYGARLDFKLSRSNEEATSVLLRFVASLAEG